MGMQDRRHGLADRRASKRGGRRPTDLMRSDVDDLRVKWQELEMAAGSAASDDRKSDDEESLAERPR
jgi:hypothetical protein